MATELPKYCPPSGAAPLSWEPGVIEALETDLARLADSTVTLPLVALIDEGFRSGAYDPKQGLTGLLERHVERSVARLSAEPGFDESAVEVARDVLKEIGASGQPGSLSLEGLAERLDVAAEVPARCHRWLVEASGVLKDTPGEGLLFQPPQLRVVIERWLQEDRSVCARAERYLADGVDGRHKVGSLLPRERFNDIHAQRSVLSATPEEASFLTLCAVHYYADADPGPVNYWFRRIGDPACQVSALSEALVDPFAPARRRAAFMLADWDEPRVHGHLCRTALADPAAEVRDQAVESLSGFANKGPVREVLTRAVSEATGDTTIHAIEALRIFRDEECARLLESIVTRPGELAVRSAAIGALARTRCEAGVSALVRIALRDEDREDRDCADAALAELGSEDLTDFGLTAVTQDWVAGRHPRDRRWWRKLGHWPAALVILFLSFFLHGLPLLVFRRWLAGIAFFAVEVACITFGVKYLSEWWFAAWWLNWAASIAVGAWVARRKHAQSGSFYRVLENSLLANTMLSGGLVLHGLGHWITGRKRKAWQLFGIEAVAVIAILPSYALESAFNLDVGRTGFDKFTPFLLYLYRFGGVSLSYLWAVSSLVVDERWGRRGPWSSEPHSRVFRALLKAPESARVLRRNLASGQAGDQTKVSSARMLLGRFGEAVPGIALFSVLEQDVRLGQPTPPEIAWCLSRHKDKKGYETVVMEAGELFDSLPPQQRDPLVGLLARYPTEGSIQCLYERRGRLRPWQRIRLWEAVIVRPFRGWHWTVRIATLAGALLALLLVVDGIRTSLNPSWPQIKELRRLSKTDFPENSRGIAAVAAFLAKAYPVSSAEELAMVFGEAKRENAQELASSLGVVATSDTGIEQRRTPEEGSAARKTAVGALVRELSNGKDKQAGRAAEDKQVFWDAAVQAVGDSARRGGSVELVDGLTALFDETAKAGPNATKEELVHLQRLQGSIAAMLANVAKQPPKSPTGPALSNKTKAAIAARGDAWGILLRASPDLEVKQAVLDALEASGHDEAVKVMKEFILFDGTPSSARQPDESKVRNPQDAHAASEPTRRQLDARSMAVDKLKAIHTPAASTAFKDLRLKQGLPAEIARKIGQSAAVALDEEARQLLEKKNLPAALETARQAVQADGELTDARATLGLALYQSGKREESLKEFRTLTSKAPSFSWAYYMQALILEELSKRSNGSSRYGEAEAALKKALEFDPYYTWNYALLRLILLDQGKDDDAVKELRHYERDYPQVGEIYSQLAFVYHERISRTDPAAYELAYKENRKLLDMVKDSDPAQALSTESNLLECELTTGRYADVVRKTPGLLVRIGKDPDLRMAVTLLKLSAQILQHDDQGALKTLAELTSIYYREFKPAGKRHTWTYDGTVNYLASRVPQSARTAAVLALVQALNSTLRFDKGADPPPAIPQALFDNIRKALESSKDGVRSQAGRAGGPTVAPV